MGNILKHMGALTNTRQGFPSFRLFHGLCYAPGGGLTKLWCFEGETNTPENSIDLLFVL